MCTLTAKRWVSPPAPQAGFTIGELMVVVGIMAFAVAIAVPNYIRWNSTAQLKQATTELQGELNLARLSAMNRNRSVTVTAAILNNLVTGVTGGPITFSSLGVRVGGGAGNQLITLTNNQALIYSIAVTPAGKSTWCPRATCP